ncbi:nitroreductase family protein [Chitinophaga pinensis]|uniref:Nitroreductase n=1 Tax=Chitinophaga pinensis (strain ATCC 43595 / DSM 2588 / LMG 13176 / NBRC 15968 / NCIMB 11800 / UQM 2034) TaxID=485918 RepID=A0A979G7Y0_CHIPD|nr:nitroreductase family protein [Chitinophaga pinensis]ACU62445.1 nitroreductase [Chitinophaga pinensis DSM 2588]
MSIKIANTQYDVIDLIKNRWSPRSFSTKDISAATLETILEAGSWAPSANNTQPWRFIYALRGTPGFDKLLATLAQGNQPWAKNAAALVATVGIRETPDTQQKNHYFMHDVGMATSFMLLQALNMEIYAHVMAGFNKQQFAETAGLGANEEAVSIVALGYIDSAEKLEEPYKTRELTARSRNPIATIAAHLD